MNLLNKTIVILLLVFSSGFLYARPVLEGKVQTENRAPLPGAAITVKGGRQSARADSAGNFRLDLKQGDILIVTCVGYARKEVIYTGSASLTITLSLQHSVLDDVIVQAYGTTTQRKNTGNITRITAEEISDQPVSNPLAALEGRVPGVVITQTSGVPGSAFNVQVHGQTVLDGALSTSDPLIVIDGVFFEPGNQPANQLRSAANNQLGQGGLSPLNSISPDDIQSIEVLKDADATAIYGSRGANGVIIITTKKARAGRTLFSGSVYSGISKADYNLPLLNTGQYVKMREEGLKNDGLTPSPDPNDPGFAPDIELWNTTRYTNFQQLLTGGDARSTDAQGSLSGGSELTQFLISGSYHRETTVFPGSFADNISSVHYSLNHSSENKKFSIVFSGGYSYDHNALPTADLTQYINLPPNLLLHNADGSLAFSEAEISYATVNNITNPLAILLQSSTAVSENLYSNLQLNYNIIKGLSAGISLSYNNFKTNEVSLFPQTSIDPYVASYTPASANFANSAISSWLIEPQLNYSKDLGRGVLAVLLGGTFEQKKNNTGVTQATNYTNDLLLDNPGAAGLVTADFEEVLYRYEALFGRLNYNWAGKYILNATFRRDGSSRFGPDQQFANFGALGAGWIFSDEDLVRQSLPALSFGKLRGSYGIIGNDQIGDYNYLSLYQNNQNTYGGVPTLLPAKLYNPDFRWQTNKKLDFGVELGWLKERINLSADWYRERSSNQLVNYTLPRQTGFSNVVMNLPANVQNSGIELALNTKNIVTTKLKWTTSLNLTLPSNKLLSFPGLASSAYRDQYTIGQPLSVIKGFRYTGVDPATGIYSFQDLNKDGALTPADYQVLGNLNPKYYGGLLNSITYRQFQLDFLLEFKKQTGRNYLSQLFNSFPGTVANQPAIVLSRWQKPGNISNIQLFTAGNNEAAVIAANTELNVSNGIYGDASYIRLKNMALSYHLPAEWIKRLGISSGKVFINAQNLLTISGYKGLDPETQNFYVLPPLRTIAAGLQFSF